MVAQYGAWAALQVAQKRYNLVSNQIIYLCKCNSNTHSHNTNNDNHQSNDELDYLPAEWKKIGITSCDTSLLPQATITIIPPTELYMLQFKHVQIIRIIIP